MARDEAKERLRSVSQADHHWASSEQIQEWLDREIGLANTAETAPCPCGRAQRLIGYDRQGWIGCRYCMQELLDAAKELEAERKQPVKEPEYKTITREDAAKWIKKESVYTAKKICENYPLCLSIWEDHEKHGKTETCVCERKRWEHNHRCTTCMRVILSVAQEMISQPKQPEKPMITPLTEERIVEQGKIWWGSNPLACLNETKKARQWVLENGAKYDCECGRGKKMCFVSASYCSHCYDDMIAYWTKKVEEVEKQRQPEPKLMTKEQAEGLLKKWYVWETDEGKRLACCKNYVDGTLTEWDLNPRTVDSRKCSGCEVRPCIVLRDYCASCYGVISQVIQERMAEVEKQSKQPEPISKERAAQVIDTWQKVDGLTLRNIVDGLPNSIAQAGCDLRSPNSVCECGTPKHHWASHCISCHNAILQVAKEQLATQQDEEEKQVVKENDLTEINELLEEVANTDYMDDNDNNEVEEPVLQNPKKEGRMKKLLWNAVFVMVAGLGSVGGKAAVDAYNSPDPAPGPEAQALITSLENGNGWRPGQVHQLVCKDIGVDVNKSGNGLWSLIHNHAKVSVVASNGVDLSLVNLGPRFTDSELKAINVAANNLLNKLTTERLQKVSVPQADLGGAKEGK